jgi:hypothetical protein
MYKFILNDIDIFYDKLRNKLFIYGKYGFVSFFLPSLFFLKTERNKLLFLFVNKFFYFSFFRHFLYFLKRVIWIFFFKLKLKGLGFRVFQVSRFFWEFFFRKNLRYFFYPPKGIYIKRKNRDILFLSNNKQLLNNIFSNLLFLKKMDFYERTKTFIVKSKILYLKKRK